MYFVCIYSLVSEVIGYETTFLSVKQAQSNQLIGNEHWFFHTFKLSDTLMLIQSTVSFL